MKNEKRQGKKLFLPFCVIRSNRLRNYFQGLKIYFQVLVIYFQCLIIYFQALKIISKHAPRQKYLSQAELANMVRGGLPTAKNYTKHKEPVKTYYDAFSQAPCSNVNHLLYYNLPTVMDVDTLCRWTIHLHTRYVEPRNLVKLLCDNAQTRHCF